MMHIRYAHVRIGLGCSLGNGLATTIFISGVFTSLFLFLLFLILALARITCYVYSLFFFSFFFFYKNSCLVVWLSAVYCLSAVFLLYFGFGDGCRLEKAQGLDELLYAWIGIRDQ
jgi:hypothetical protein